MKNPGVTFVQKPRRMIWYSAPNRTTNEIIIIRFLLCLEYSRKEILFGIPYKWIGSLEKFENIGSWWQVFYLTSKIIAVVIFERKIILKNGLIIFQVKLFKNLSSYSKHVHAFFYFRIKIMRKNNMKDLLRDQTHYLFMATKKLWIWILSFLRIFNHLSILKVN